MTAVLYTLAAVVLALVVITTIRRFGLTKATLILLGLRTDCCGAKIYSPFGWARGYCESCERRVW